MWTLSPEFQREVSRDDYEVIVVDNGSTDPVDQTLCQSFGARLTFVDVPDPTPSPCRAINLGLQIASADLCGVFIDGARMASPGLIRTAIDASRIDQRAVIGTLAFHLGPALQMISVHTGYDATAEDALLETVHWRSDGYRLFDISVLAGSSLAGWFVAPNEANALFMSASMWADLGGYDEAFTSPGGGLANLDMLIRACEQPGSQLITLLGEATFHQVHGGVATNALSSPVPGFHEEYRRLRGRPCVPPQQQPLLIGRVHPGILPSLITSIGQAVRT